MPIPSTFAYPAWVFIPLLLLFCGCGETPAIRTYTVSKESPDRLLGGMLLLEDRAWFFKVSGPREELDAQEPKFRELLKSIQIGEQSPQPDWKLPEGWEVDDSRPPNEMRWATIKVPLKPKPAELTVTLLPRQPGSDDVSYVLSNLNRWREQMRQGRVTPQELESLEKIESPAGSIYFVSLAGRMKAQSMPPLAGGM